jgi:hypothetical protein
VGTLFVPTRADVAHAEYIAQVAYLLCHILSSPALAAEQGLFQLLCPEKRVAWTARPDRIFACHPVVAVKVFFLQFMAALWARKGHVADFALQVYQAITEKIFVP